MARTRRKKKRTHVKEDVDPAKKGDPKSFVFRRGKNAVALKDLEADLRKLMQPNTAANLRESKRNVLKDFIHVAGPLGVTHFLILTATQTASYLRLAKSPRGPTLTLKIHEYALCRDVTRAQQNPRQPTSMYLTPPLLVMNNFNGGGQHLQLATVLFQNLFPAINVNKVKLSTCQRVLLLNYNASTERISMRHYSVNVTPSGINKNMKQLLGRKKLPNLADCTDISEFISKSGYGSESEGEEAAESRVTLSQDIGKGNVRNRQSRVRLCEVGPRLELEIVKAEEGLCGGAVLYHKYVTKSKAQVAEQNKVVEDREALRQQRRHQQEDNVRKKEADKKRKAEAAAATSGKGKGGKRPKMWWDEGGNRREGAAVDEDDDVQYYRQEVGEEPGPDIGLRRRSNDQTGQKAWKKDATNRNKKQRAVSR